MRRTATFEGLRVGVLAGLPVFVGRRAGTAGNWEILSAAVDELDVCFLVRWGAITGKKVFADRQTRDILYKLSVGKEALLNRVENGDIACWC